MKRRTRYIVFGGAVVMACAASFGAGLIAQESLEGGRFQSSPGGTSLEVLYDGAARDVPVDVGILTFPAGTNSGDHQHAQTELFFVLEGALEHVVNGESTILGPGMFGFVEPPDFVNHITDADGPPTRALVIWAPSGAAAGLAGRWDRVSRDDERSGR
jgi:quercetin dioxygenase-like cupin family protein